MIRVLVVPPEDMLLRDTQELDRELLGVGMTAIICHPDETEVKADIVLVVLGKSPDLALLRRIGAAARNIGAPLCYTELPSGKVGEVLWRALGHTHEPCSQQQAKVHSK